MTQCAQLALDLEPSSEVASDCLTWQSIDSAPKDRAVQIGYRYSGRWAWLFHTAWNHGAERPGWYCDGEELRPSHWRDIGEPE